MKARALYVWKSPYPWEVRIEKICTELADNGFETYVLCRWAQGQKKEEEYKNHYIIRAGYQKPNSFYIPVSYNPYWIKDISDVVKAIKPDVIIPREIMLSSACASIGHKNNIPVIYDIAEHYPAAMKGFPKYWEKIHLRLAVHYLKIPELTEKNTLKKADGIITITEELKNRFINKYHIPPEKIAIVSNTPNLDNFKNVRKGSSIPPRVFVYNGHITPDRNIENLIEGFILACKIQNDIELIIAGSGPKIETLHTKAKNSDFADRIKFTGYYQPEEIYQIYDKMDIGMLPFKNNEFINHIIANKFFDYMACGKPIICSKARPMKRIMDEVNFGLSIDCSKAENIRDAIIEIQNCPLDLFSKNALEFAEKKYNWKIDAKNLIDFIKKFA